VRDRIFIIGGGPSIKNIDLTSLTKERTITVNASVFDVSNSDYFVTMDHTFLRKIAAKKHAFQNVTGTKVFVAGLHNRHLKELRGGFVDIRNNKVYNLQDFDVIIKSRVPHGCSFTFDSFRSGENSGFCALQWAVLLNYKEIYLVGMDMTVTNTTHYHDLYPKQRTFVNKLKLYEKNFRLGLSDIQKHSDIEVLSCSSISLLNDVIEYKPLKDVLNESR
jgi:hypothetical protein